MKNKIIKTLLVIFIILILCVIYLYYQNTQLQVTNYLITDNKIPNDFNNFKIIQISDFHNTKNKRLKNKLVNEIKKQEPDIIVITGDLIDSSKPNLNNAINFIKEINKVADIYFVSGNHEASYKNYSELKNELIKNKVTILENETKILEINDSKINLIGIEDPVMNPNPYDSDENVIKSSLEHQDYNKDNYSILLSHRPEQFNTYVNNNLNLVLTGHAHGGQIRIPFIGGLVAPNQELFPKYTSGQFTEENTTMIISRGIGNSILPFRINNRPELVIVELSNK